MTQESEEDEHIITEYLQKLCKGDAKYCKKFRTAYKDALFSEFKRQFPEKARNMITPWAERR